ncbi:hypothetical protein BHE74_00019907 [Ensete ventricosum]|nr:hypothetical protein BHE74_00019907 [Ensete ventricosum]RZS24096.1 hypothetical protein BHM03_00057129 [Ensete ventricosum]
MRIAPSILLTQLLIAPALSLPCRSTSPVTIVIAPSAAYSHNRDPTIRLPSRITVAVTHGAGISNPLSQPHDPTTAVHWRTDESMKKILL